MCTCVQMCLSLCMYSSVGQWECRGMWCQRKTYEKSFCSMNGPEKQPLVYVYTVEMRNSLFVASPCPGETMPRSAPPSNPASQRNSWIWPVESVSENVLGSFLCNNKTKMKTNPNGHEMQADRLYCLVKNVLQQGMWLTCICSHHMDQLLESWWRQEKAK